MLLQYNLKHVSVAPSSTPVVVNHKVHNEYQKKHCFRQKNGNFLATFGRKLFFCADGPATPDILLQYNCKHVSVGPSPTLVVVNHKVHNEYHKKHYFPQNKLAIHGPFWVKTDFFFVLEARQPPLYCSNTTANTFQWVRPRPRRSSMIL